MIHAACGRTSMFVPQFSGIFSVSIPLLYLIEQECIAIRFSMPRSLSIRRMTILVSLEMPSIVVKIAYGNTSFLFTGDAEWDPEHDMVDSGYDLSASLLKVGHHGGGTSSSYVFLREVMPQYAVISVREGNSYGHPSEDTLSRLQDAGTVVYRTDVCGNIICYSDGSVITFETEHETPYNFGSSTYSNAYMRMSGTDTNYEPYIECVFSGSTAVG